MSEPVYILWRKFGHPDPGSGSATEAGCTCPVMDNAYGKGRYCDGLRHGWWISEGCPLHATLRLPPAPTGDGRKR